MNSHKHEFILLLAVILLLPSLAFCELPGGAWLEIGPGGRAAGLAEAVTASVDGATATYWNPAAVGLDGSRVEFMHASWIADASTQYVTADFQLGEWGVGVSALHVDINDLELRTAPTTDPEGTFRARSYAVGGTMARTLPLWGIRFGLSAKYLDDQIYAYEAEGWSMDFGLLKQGLFDGKLDLAATLRHLGSMNELDQESYDLPTTYSGGVCYHVGEIGVVSPSAMVDVVKVLEHDISIRGGVELQVLDNISFRGGYATGYETRGLSAGIGLHWRGWRFDYGYSPFSEDLGDAQRISVSASW